MICRIDSLSRFLPPSFYCQMVQLLVLHLCNAFQAIEQLFQFLKGFLCSISQHLFCCHVVGSFRAFFIGFLMIPRATNKLNWRTIPTCHHIQLRIQARFRSVGSGNVDPAKGSISVSGFGIFIVSSRRLFPAEYQSSGIETL